MWEGKECYYIMNARKVCSNCRFSNVPNATFCQECGSRLGSHRTRSSAVVPTQSNRNVPMPRPPALRTLDKAPADLEKLWSDFYRLRGYHKQGGWLWELLLKHIAAHDLDVKINEAKGRIEDMQLEGYVQSHKLAIQRFLTLQAKQIAHEQAEIEQQHEQRLARLSFDFDQQTKDEALQRDLLRRLATYKVDLEMADAKEVGRIRRINKVIQTIENELLSDSSLMSQGSTSPDFMREFIFDLLHLAMDAIYDKDKKASDSNAYLNELDDLVDL